MASFRLRFVVGGDFGCALVHPFVARNQQRLGLGVFLLRQQHAPQQAPGVERPPIVGTFLFADCQALAGQRLGLGQSVRTQVSLGQVIHRLERVGVVWSQFGFHSV